MFKLNLHDLQFVLKQIKIGEANANGTALTEIRVDASGEVITDRAWYTNQETFDASFVRAIPDPLTPYGIRTVDGTYNNLVPGQEKWGASGQPMPRLLDAGAPLNEADGDTIAFGNGAVLFNNNNYAPGTASNTAGVANGSVVDADPRIISNLIVDMSAKNPAALMAALTFAGVENPLVALQELLATRPTSQAVQDVDTAKEAFDIAATAYEVALASYAAADPAGQPAALDALQTAAETLSAAAETLDSAQAIIDGANEAFAAKAAELGLEFDDTGSLIIPNVAPDEGLSAPFNSWMTFFGQFFDHGLDLITKGGAGTIYIPLQPDDPLYNPLTPHTNFMVLTRSTPVDANGNPTTDPDLATQENVTTSWVDQNQTYTSHASHQVFLREYKFSVDTNDDGVLDARPVATGKLLDGTGPDGVTKNGLPTWFDIKKQAADVLGIRLTDADVGKVPMLLTDAYGEFIRGTNGLPQLLAAVNPDGTPIYVEGNLANPINPSAIQLPGGQTVSAARTPNAFLDDIAHAAQAVNSRGQPLQADLDDQVGITQVANPAYDADLPIGPGNRPFLGVLNPAFDDGQPVGPTNLQYLPVSGFFDNELLDAHFITGDGRGNENFGLTAVHHVFHSEHNRQVDSQKLTILSEGDLTFVNSWLAAPITLDQLTAIKAALAVPNVNKAVVLGQLEDAVTVGNDAGVPGVSLNWDGERLFQAGRMATEMQYQHLVFEEFGRKIQPAIDPFVFNAVTDIDPSIFSEFANVVYRFGHSMLTDSMPRVFLNADGTTTHDDMGLIASFLNPLAFNNDGTLTAEEAAGAIVRGMTVERGNEIDEFLTGALRNSLLGIPLDLAAINIARGRDTNMPSLNEAREQLYAASSSTFLKPYDSWVEFAANIKNPMSVVNFIAAYGTHTSITGTVEEKREAAMKLVFGDSTLDNPDTEVNEAAAFNADRVAFLNSTGSWTAANSGLDSIDLWIGGLAEKKMPFGGFLGSTFNAVFELQMENLQDGDRFYYLTRTQGLNFLVELEQNSFAKMIMANTDISNPGVDGIRGTPDDTYERHIGVDSFATYDYVFEVDEANQEDYNGALPGKDPSGNDPVLEALGFTKVVRDDPRTDGPDENYFRTFGGEHVVVGGTAGADTIITDFGDDGIWGDAGNDRIESGAGVDLVNGGAGDDIITDSGDTGDFLKGDSGNDVIANSNGLDILMGGTGQDVILVGVDSTEVFAGEGNDFVLGGDGVDLIMGNAGDDWLEGGGGFDTTAGDNSELFFNSTILGHDVMFAGTEEHDFDAESGDDIMVQGPSVMRNEGMFGFDWSIHKGNVQAADSDLTKPIFTTDQADTLRDRFDTVEALSGWEKNDVLRGDNRADPNADGTEPLLNPGLAAAEGTMVNHELTHGGVDRIDGLRSILGTWAGPVTTGFEGGVAFNDGNILLGGGGSDTIEGRGGNDIIDGDSWLNVRISIRAPDPQNPSATIALASIDSLKHTFSAADLDPDAPQGAAIPAAWIGKTLSELMIARTITPLQLNIVREIIEDDGVGDIDTAVFTDDLANYTITRDTDGSLLVTHNIVTAGLVSDGVDKLWNVERAQFADQTVGLVAPTLELNGFDNGSQPANPPSIDIAASYVEDAAATPIASLPRIIDDGVTLASARIVLTNAFDGDQLTVTTALPAGITATTAIVGATIVVTLNGTASLAAYQAAIQSIGFSSTSQNPDTTERLIEVTVNDGVFDSNVARTRVAVTSVNDAPNAVNDTIVTNIQGNFVVPDWALLANDTDADGTLSISGITESQNSFSVARSASATTFGYTTTADRTATYTATDGALSDTATATVERDAGNINGGVGAQIIVGDGANSTINGGLGNDIIFSGAGNDTVNGGGDDDTLVWNVGDGRDFLNGGANATDAGDLARIEGSADSEAFVVYSRAAALANGITGLNGATEIVITRNGQTIAELDNVEEILINTGDGSDSVTTIGDFTPTSLNFNTITINGGTGNDTVDLSALGSAHRIVFRTNGGNDTIVGTLRPQDVIELPAGSDATSYVRTFDPLTGLSTLSNGTNQVVFSGDFDPGVGVNNPTQPEPAGFTLTASDLTGLKAIVAGGPTGDGDFEAVLGVRELSGFGNNEADPTRGTADVPFIRLTEARYGEFDPTIGNNKINPIFDGLDARAISNILGTQEADLPLAANESNIFFMAFGQYFDHGLDFLPKSSANGIIEIGGPGSGRAPGTDNPADLTRGAVHEIDENGVPQHLNLTSPYVDQNQAYGSNALVGQFLRETDGNGGIGAKLLAGVPDPSSPGFHLLPTLRELIEHHWSNDTTFTGLAAGPATFRTYFAGLVDGNGVINQAMVPGLASNFMGSGHALLLDANPYINLLDHFVAGDGRANENISLTAIHTVWARNHNFHVENLLNSGFEGTPEEVFQAAKVINEAEYARVVFTEFADKLLGGIQGTGSHGFEAYNPDATAGISHEFAAAVYRFGHSLISDTLTVVGPDGQPRQVQLFDAFLNPTNDTAAFTLPVAQLNQFGYFPQPGFAQIGVSGIVEGTISQQAEEADFNIVNAVRNDLVRINADLFAFNVARGRDVGLGTLNQVRADLQASTDPYIREALSYAGNLDPYASWEDFQQRNGLTDSIIAQFKQAYPDLVLDTPEKIAAFVATNPDIALVGGNTVKGIDRVDLWVGGLAEKHIMDGMVGQTFWIVLHEQFDRLQEADRFYYIDRLDNFDLYENIIDGQTFGEIIARNTGLTNLPERVFEISDEDNGIGQGDGDQDNDGDEDGGTVGTGDDEGAGEDEGDEDGENDGGTVGSGDNEDEDDEDGDDDTVSSGDDEDCGCDDDDVVTPPPGSSSGGALRVGTAQADVLLGTAGSDNIIGLAGDDVLIGEAGDDTVTAGEGADFVDAGEGADIVFLGAGNDQGFGGAGQDALYGEAGDDRVFGGAGNDRLDGGAGNDTVVGGVGDDLIVAATGDGDDTYHGDDLAGGAGVDTLDMSSITASITVDLGSGLLGRGSAFSVQSGQDTLWSIENVATGAGDDTITASTAVNVMEGGDGEDVFRFTSAQAADGDTILDFEPGDRLDLSAIDANTGADGNQSFTIVSGANFTTSAQLLVTYETRADGNYTVVSGNVNGDQEADFQINLKGTYSLTPASIGL